MATMTEEPIKFRCYRCNKLLGVSARKVGSIVSCPQCRAELEVPRLEAAGDQSTPSAVPEVAVEPSAPTSASTVPSEFLAEPSESAQAVDDALLVAIQVDPPSIRRGPETARPRTQDVVLSPAVVLAWSLLVLMAVPLAFIAGLLTGRFVWK